jgi:hypothetical protein
VGNLGYLHLSVGLIKLCNFSLSLLLQKTVALAAHWTVVSRSISLSTHQPTFHEDFY